jgi:transposase
VKQLIKVVDQLDLTHLYNSYDNWTSNWWRPAYHPKMMILLFLYAYLNWVFSSRKIWRLTQENIWAMYLTSESKPKFTTINDFRRQKWKEIELIFVETVLLAQELGMIWFHTLSIDGTKIYANASKQETFTQEWLEKKIREFLKKSEEEDEEEDLLYWEGSEDWFPEEYKDPKKFEEAIKKAKERIEETKKIREEEEKKYEKIKESKEKLEEENRKRREDKTKKDKKRQRKQICITDNESRLMPMKRKDYANWYNCQIVVEKGIIVWNYVSNSAWDVRELIPSLEKLKSYGKKPEIILADKWYSSRGNYEYLKENKIEALIPVYNDKLKREEERERLRSERWKEIYKQRAPNVEWVFAVIKRVFWFERFNLRWLEKVKIEWNLINIVHNLKKIMKFQFS